MGVGRCYPYMFHPKPQVFLTREHDIDARGITNCRRVPLCSRETHLLALHSSLYAYLVCCYIVSIRKHNGDKFYRRKSMWVAANNHKFEALARVFRLNV